MTIVWIVSVYITVANPPAIVPIPVKNRIDKTEYHKFHPKAISKKIAPEYRLTYQIEWNEIK